MSERANIGWLAMSPMAGVSDSPGRIMSRRYGAHFSFTEFGGADYLAAGNQDTLKLYEFTPEERPIIFQIFGSDPDSIRKAVQILLPLEPDQLDLNMGCSVNRVAMKGAGAGLLRNPEKAGVLLEIMRKESNLPVSAKIRIGWDSDALNFLEVGRILEESGACALSVHGRTAAQGYRGLANHEPASLLAGELSIPVFGNGDIASYEQADAFRKSQGLAGVLIGRASIGNPFVFSPGCDVGPDQKLEAARVHLDLSLSFHGRQGLYIFRKHLSRYLDFLAPEERRRYLTETEPDTLFRALEQLQEQRALKL
ncbi:MAG TPA: tRNA dihydrouridine synthase DusB [Leptospiraceae bacterium]|nr:tRNA dihydrouridine synthase DusB [Spirochaetaceae bacterium]HBS03901.1 tRNA dihydrouridine synthase DusB [Leptospiraceae bacterium]|tara:strand:- start:16027 stop:16956 length:930 start_codon:yes stop_codon:yes gene_type:complete